MNVKRIDIKEITKMKDCRNCVHLWGSKDEYDKYNFCVNGRKINPSLKKRRCDLFKEEKKEESK